MVVRYCCRPTMASVLLLLFLLELIHCHDLQIPNLDSTLYVSSEWDNGMDYRKPSVIKLDDEYRHGRFDSDAHFPQWNPEELKLKLRRRRRQTSTGDHVKTYLAPLNDKHKILLVHWAGEGSDVIIALLNDNVADPQRQNSSTVMVSSNYGKNYTNVDHLFNVYWHGNRVPAFLKEFHNSPVFNSHYVFTDIVHNYTFTTTDYVKTVNAHPLVFCPRKVSLHPKNYSYILAMDSDHPEKKLYLSRDFGFSWSEIQTNIDRFFWDTYSGNGELIIYMQRRRPYGEGIIIKRTLGGNNWEDREEEMFIGALQFELKNEYMFATKLMPHAHHGELEFHVSHNRGQFLKATFPYDTGHREFYVADASEGQLFVVARHVHHNGITVSQSPNLYISEVNGINFTMSLERIVYCNPKSYTRFSPCERIRFYIDSPLVDLHRVDGMNGVYIATQYLRDPFSIDNLRSLISFDKGGEWQLLTAPLNDADGSPLNCAKERNCSLHVTQLLHRYYPRSRSAPILSKKSAPGLILASGTIGSTILKSSVSTLISTDAGWTWRQLFRTSFHYTIGDHGGIIVMVPNSSPTDEFLYSHDEGLTWTSHKLADRKMMVFGILTEPGEKTAQFSIYGTFGFEDKSYEWVVVLVDLKGIFKYNCTKDDYKSWTFEESTGGRECLLGRKLVIQRRLPHSDCYNGKEYVREIVLKNCPCTRYDYECDVGYQHDSLLSGCTLIDPNHDPHTIPNPCRPGTFYPHTKGYRKVAGDTCSGGQEMMFAPEMFLCPVRESRDFLIYTNRSGIRKLDLVNMTDMRLLSGLDASYAIEFSVKNNTLFWSDAEQDMIERLHLNRNSFTMPETTLRGDLGTVEAIALDWTSDNIYIVDAEEQKILVTRAINIGDFPKQRRVLFDNRTLDNPRGIALYPTLGIMFWTDWASANPRIVRSWMDGYNESVTILVEGRSNVVWPNGIAVDYSARRIYWTDAILNHIASADINGHSVRIILQSSSLVMHPYAIGILKNQIYWSDYRLHAILTANKFNGLGAHILKGNISGIMDVKVFSFASQQGKSSCGGVSNGGCHHLCLPRPANLSSFEGQSRTCLCFDGTENVKKLQGTYNEQCSCIPGSCNVTGNHTTCRSGNFVCDNKNCISNLWVCDKENDCGDDSDEKGCPFSTCPAGTFQCKTGNCIPARWHCDHDDDCGDMSDEDPVACKPFYPNCTAEEFRCTNDKCIRKTWICDGDDDCSDGGDESNCHLKEICDQLDDVFSCVTSNSSSNISSYCVSRSSVCNGYQDCADGSDEANCTNTTCTDRLKFSCDNGQRCIPQTWVCDGAADCNDASDENCTDRWNVTSTTTAVPHLCPANKFQCMNGYCVEFFELCDGVNDCYDWSDEYGCRTSSPGPGTTLPFTTAKPPVKNCGDQRFRCAGRDQTCIWNSWVCDGDADCPQGDDESKETCAGAVHCSKSEYRCYKVAQCVHKDKVCDGNVDCADRSDEEGCGNKTTVPVNSCNADREFSCQVGGTCLLWMYTCNGKQDCPFASDEHLPRCKGRQYKIMFLDHKVHTQENTITLSWNKVVPREPGKVSYIISYFVFGKPGTWINETATENTTKTLDNLSPLTKYAITVYVNVNGTVYSPIAPVMVNTSEGVPEKPRHVHVFHTDDDIPSILVMWEKPLSYHGRIMEYIVYYKDTQDSNPPRTKQVFTYGFAPRKYSATIQHALLHSGRNYTIWVQAFTAAGGGSNSTKESIVYQYRPTCEDPIQNLKSSKVNASSVSLSWPPYDKNCHDVYIVYVSSKSGGDKMHNTKSNQFIVTNLCPATTYTFMVKAVNSKTGTRTSPSNEVIATTQGTKLVPDNSPGISLSLVDTTSVRVDWSKTFTTSKESDKQHYTVYYAVGAHMLEVENIEKLTKKTSVTGELSTLIEGLQACQKYFFAVDISDAPKCSLSSIAAIQTLIDEKAQPKNVAYTQINSTFVNITWQTSCDEKVLFVGYHLVLKTKNQQRGVTLAQKTNKTTFSLVQKLQPGETYTVTIKTVVPGSRFSDPLVIVMRPWSPPFNVHFSGGSFEELSWEAPSSTDVPPNKIKGYEVFIKTAKDKDFKYFCNTTNLLANVSHFKISQGLFTAKVRVVMVNGVRGAFSQEVIGSMTQVGPEPNGNISISKKNLAAIIIPVAAVVLVLFLVVGILAYRHSRLQRSFLAYARSRYDRDSETTRFTSANDLGEDEDSPMIRGFSDDEPLVVG